MANIAPRQQIFDAVVVGSGATGGWAAKELTEAGLRVAVVEAGRALDPTRDFSEHVLPYQVKYRGHSPEMLRTRFVQAHSYACREYNYKWFVNDLKNPYTRPQDKPFNWIRLRIEGGRSLVWGRLSLRLSDLDFKGASHDGYGDDWPISYTDLAPYYDKVESFIGVSGFLEGLPQLPDGKFLPGMKFTCGEWLMKRAIEKQWSDRRVTIGRTAILTAPLNGRAKCHFCGHCDRGCTTHSYFSSPGSTLPAAAKTGRMTLRTDSIARKILVDSNTGKARGVAIVDQNTKL